MNHSREVRFFEMVNLSSRRGYRQRSAKKDTVEMATARKLLSIVGKPLKRSVFQALVATDKLKAYKEQDLKEGQPVATNFIGKKVGYEISTESGRVVAVFLYAVTADGFAAFSKPLPYGVPYGATRTEVRRLLGKPELSGQAYVDDILGPQGAWDRFAIELIRIHFQYTNPGLQVRLVTLMTVEDAH